MFLNGYTLAYFVLLIIIFFISLIGLRFTLLITSFFKTISLIPIRVQLSLGKYIGLLLFKYVKKRKAVVLWNLSKCFPKLNREEVHKTAKENFIRLFIIFQNFKKKT